MPTPSIAASVAVRIGALMDSTVGAAFGKTTTGLRRIGEAMRELTSCAQAVRRLDAENVRLGESVTVLTARYDKQATTLATAEARLARLRERSVAAGAADEKLAAQVARADATVVRAQSNLDRTSVSLTKAKSDLAQASTGAEQFRAANQHVEGSLVRLGAAMKRYDAANTALHANESKRAEYRSRMLGVLATGYFIKKSVERAAQGEETALRFRWSLDGRYNERQIGALIAQTRAAAAHSLATTPELLSIQTVLHKEDLSGEDAQQAALTVHRVAAVTKADSEAVARAIGGIFHTVGVSMSGATEQRLERIGDLVATLQQRFEIHDVEGLAAGLTKALPQANMARVSFEQTGAAIGSLTRSGVDAAAAGQQLGAMLRNLTKASQELGFHVVRDARGELDFEATLRAMNARIEQMGGLAKARDLLTKAFTRRGADAAYFLSQAAASGELAKAQTEMADSAGRVAREYRQLTESAQGMLLKIGKALNQTLLPIGRALLPSVKAVLEPLGKLAEWIGTLLDRHKTLAAWIGGVATALLGTTAIAYGAGYAWTVLTGGLLKLDRALAWVNLKLTAHRLGLLESAGAAATAAAAEEGLAGAEAAAGTGLLARIPLLGRLGAMFATLGASVASASTGIVTAVTGFTAPVWAAVGAVAAIVAVVGLLVYKYWTPIKAFFQGVGTGIGQALAPLLPLLETVWSTIRGFFAWLAEDNTTRDGFERAFGAGIWFGQKLGAVLVTVAETIGIVIRGVGALGTAIVNVASGNFAALGTVVTDWWQSTAGSLAHIKSAWSGGDATAYAPARSAAAQFDTNRTTRALGAVAQSPVPNAYREMASANAGAGSTSFQSTFHIHAGSAQDGRAIATQVRDEMERWVRDSQARRRGGLHD